MIIKKRYIVSIILLSLACFVFSSCENLFPVSREEINRITSPDGKVDAILVETDAGATTSYGYNVYIVPKGGNFEVGYAAFIADHIKNLEIEWIKPKLLNISYDEARIFKFANIWQSRDADNFGYVVELKLNSDSERFFLSTQDRE